MKGTTFVVFAVPNTFYPVNRDWYVRAHPSGIAPVLPNGKLQFAGGNSELQPFAKSEQTTLEAVKGAASR